MNIAHRDSAPGTGEALACVNDAYLAPGPLFGPMALTDAAGRVVREGTIYRRGKPIEMLPARSAEADTAERIEGTWLFAGDFWMHFGHFLFESLGRLWAMPRIADRIDGLIFVSPRRQPLKEIAYERFQFRLLRLLGIDLPIRVVTEPARVDRLYVPEQGCGMGALSTGTRAFRDFVTTQLGRSVTPGPARRVYISRTGYQLQRGGIFGEHLIEEFLAEEGYVSFQPERAPLEEQVATYLGAEKVISPDSSALHFVGFVARPKQDIAILLRRVGGASDMLPQLTAFTGRTPLVIDRIESYQVHDATRNETWARFAELDMAGVGRDLAEAGFIERPEIWAGPSHRRRRRMAVWHERRVGASLRREGRDSFVWTDFSSED